MFVFRLSSCVYACGLISWLQSTHVSINLFDRQMFVFQARHVYCCCFLSLKLLFYLWFLYCFFCIVFVCLFVFGFVFCFLFFYCFLFCFVLLLFACFFCFLLFSVFVLVLFLLNIDIIYKKLTLQRFICDKHLSTWNKLWNPIMFC